MIYQSASSIPRAMRASVSTLPTSSSVQRQKIDVVSVDRNVKSKRSGARFLHCCVHSKLGFFPGLPHAITILSVPLISVVGVEPMAAAMIGPIRTVSDGLTDYTHDQATMSGLVRGPDARFMAGAGAHSAVTTTHRAREFCPGAGRRSVPFGHNIGSVFDMTKPEHWVHGKARGTFPRCLGHAVRFGVLRTSHPPMFRTGRNESRTLESLERAHL